MRRRLLACSAFLALFFVAISTVSPAHAAVITVDELLFEGDPSNPTVLSGSVEMTLSGSSLTIVLKNTSTAVSPDGNGSSNLLTSLAFRLPTGVTISSGTATVPGGATNLGFLATATNVGSEWGYRQGVLGSGHWNDDGPATLGYNVAISSHLADVSFEFDAAAPDLGVPGGLGGPDFGLLSALVPNSAAGGQEAIKAPLTIVLALAGTLPANLLQYIEDNPVGIGFASPNQSFEVLTTPEPTSLAIACSALAMCGIGYRRRKESAERLSSRG